MQRGERAQAAVIYEGSGLEALQIHARARQALCDSGIDETGLEEQRTVFFVLEKDMRRVLLRNPVQLARNPRHDAFLNEHRPQPGNVLISWIHRPP